MHFEFLNFLNFIFLDVLDIKPVNMEQLTEVITSASFSPTHPAQFLYSTSKGVIRLCDMRKSALCDTSATSTLCLCLLSPI